MTIFHPSITLQTTVLAGFAAAATLAAVRFVPPWVERALRRGGSSATIDVFAGHVARLLVILLGVAIVLPMFGLSSIPLVSLATVSLAFSLGIQSLLSNLFAGVTIVAEHDLNVGDLVTVGGDTGHIVDFRLRKVVLADPTTGDTIAVPNAVVISQTVRRKKRPEGGLDA